MITKKDDIVNRFSIYVRSATKIRKDLIDTCPKLKIIDEVVLVWITLMLIMQKGKGINVINIAASSISTTSICHLFSSADMHIGPLNGDKDFKN